MQVLLGTGIVIWHHLEKYPLIDDAVTTCAGNVLPVGDSELGIVVGVTS